MTGEDGSGSTIMRVTPLVGLNLAKRRFDNVMEGRGGGLITGDMRGVFRPSGGSELHSACSGYPLLLLCCGSALLSQAVAAAAATGAAAAAGSHAVPAGASAGPGGW